jgi:hypothetical protein
MQEPSTKKMFKVISPITNNKGETVYWMRIGNAFTNKDDSLNIYLDALPRTFQLQLRELDEEDLRRRETHRHGSARGSQSANERAPSPPVADMPY